MMMRLWVDKAGRLDENLCPLSHRLENAYALMARHNHLPIISTPCQTVHIDKITYH